MMETRTRRLRGGERLRRMARETRLSPDSLVYPLFVREGEGIEEELSALPGQVRYSPDRLAKGVLEALEAGVRSFLLFGIPARKDEGGSGAYDENGVIQQGLRWLNKEFAGEICVITDLCLCEYTSHGHCGLMANETVDNEATLPLLAKTALSHMEAGSSILAPSGMMDGAVSAIRAALDESGFKEAPIMSYAAKFSSSFYGPFRDAACSAPQYGDRKAYQMDYHNGREAIRRIKSDIAQGADMVIVKPAMSYLDIVSEARRQTEVPIAAYSVSGEYAMIKAAAAKGLIDEYGAVCESAAGAFRAGADILITYYAKELAKAIKDGDIG